MKQNLQILQILKILVLTLVIYETKSYFDLISNENSLLFDKISEDVYPEQHKVTIFDIPQTVYSGFFQVHQSGSKLYYQLFSPSNSDIDNTIPIIIWIEGGPGSSSQNSNFKQIGPVQLKRTSDGKIIPEKREINWCEQYHCLFIDNPVGVGYSVSFNNYKVTSSEQSAQDLYQFLQRFYIKYSYLKANPVYIAGESYAGHYIPAIAEVILKEQKEQLKINLLGILIGSGLVDMYHQVQQYAYMPYAASLSTPKNVQTDLKVATIIRQKAKKQQYQEVAQQTVELMLKLARRGGVLQNDFRDNPSPPIASIIPEYLNSSETKKSFGLPISINYTIFKDEIFNQFKQDIGRSMIQKFEVIIPKIKVLIYSGQDDINVGTMGIWEWILNLPDSYFPNKQHIQKTKKQIWKLKENHKVSGNVKILDNFYFAIIYNGGHTPALKVPKTSKDMITRFINNDKNWSN